VFWASMHIRDEKKEYVVESRRIKEIVVVFWAAMHIRDVFRKRRGESVTD
jgi:hypothetical protein